MLLSNLFNIHPESAAVWDYYCLIKTDKHRQYDAANILYLYFVFAVVYISTSPSV